MSTPSLLILAGDGIGPEVMAQVRRIIDWYGAKRDMPFGWQEKRQAQLWFGHQIFLGLLQRILQRLHILIVHFQQFSVRTPGIELRNAHIVAAATGAVTDEMVHSRCIRQTATPAVIVIEIRTAPRRDTLMFKIELVPWRVAFPVWRALRRRAPIGRVGSRNIADDLSGLDLDRRLINATRIEGGKTMGGTTIGQLLFAVGAAVALGDVVDLDILVMRRRSDRLIGRRCHVPVLERGDRLQ